MYKCANNPSMHSIPLARCLSHLISSHVSHVRITDCRKLKYAALGFSPLVYRSYQSAATISRNTSPFYSEDASSNFLRNIGTYLHTLYGITSRNTVLLTLNLKTSRLTQIGLLDIITVYRRKNIEVRGASS